MDAILYNSEIDGSEYYLLNYNPRTRTYDGFLVLNNEDAGESPFMHDYKGQLFSKDGRTIILVPPRCTCGSCDECYGEL